MKKKVICKVNKENQKIEFSFSNIKITVTREFLEDLATKEVKELDIEYEIFDKIELPNIKNQKHCLLINEL